MVIFFAYVRSQGITEHICNMAIAIAKYANLLIVFDSRIEPSKKYITKLKAQNIEYIDISELKRVIDKRFNKVPLLFHCQGFSHLKKATKISRPKDKIMLSVHCFRHALWYAKVVAILSYSLFFRSVDMWHFLSQRNRDEYFWYKKFPSYSCVFPLGVEEMFMTKKAQPLIVKDLNGEDITDLSERVNIVYIAQFQTWKRHSFLLRSLKSILKGNTFLILLGDGPIINKIINLSKDLGIREHVIFTGRVNRKTVQYVLSNASLAVTVSPSETFGWCLLEPFCMEVPIVSTNVGIANALISDFHNGFILNPNCTEYEFREKIKLALKYLKHTNNSEAKHLYSWDIFGKTTQKCYVSILKPKGKAGNSPP